MNVIDYFIEKWNKVKSNGESGLRKEFVYEKAERNKKKLKEFDQKPNAKISEYLAYRNTKPQKIRQTENESTIKYNRRKLNELVNIILMLNDRETKIELLKEHVCFNYEFMLSKAELRELYFVVDKNQQIIELGDQELIDILQIYVSYFPSFENKPKSLCWTVVTRFPHRNSTYMRQLQLQSHLLLLHQSITDDFCEKDIFLTDNHSRIYQFHEIHEAPYLFIHTRASDENDKSPDSLHLMNSTTKQRLGQLDLPIKNAESIQIVIENHAKELENLKSINDLNGRIYCTSTKTVLYSISFINGDYVALKKFDKNINFLFSLSSKFLLGFFQKTIILMNGLESAQPQDSVQVEDEIIEVKPTLKENTVYLSGTLNNFDKIMIIVGLKNKIIKIYQFTRKLKLIHTINDINWSFYGFGKWNGIYLLYRQSIIIDESFLTKNTKDESMLNEALKMRFAVEENGTVKVIDIFDNHHHVADEVTERNLNLSINSQIVNSSRLQLISMFKNKIALMITFEAKRKLETGKSNLFIYNLSIINFSTFLSTLVINIFSIFF